MPRKLIKNLPQEYKNSICVDYINGMLIDEIAIKYNTNEYTIVKIAKEANLEMRYKFSDEKFKFLVEEYYRLRKDNYTQMQIAKILKISYKTIRKILLQEKLISKITYDINDSYFNNIDTFAKGQILGMLWADGWIRDKVSIIGIALQEKDKQYLEFISKEWESNYLIKLRKKEKRIKSFVDSNKFIFQQNQYTLTITSKEMYENLKTFGITSNKSYDNAPLPKIDEKYLKGFILGYFEGDGCIYYNYNIINNKIICQFYILFQEKMALEIKEYMESKLNISMNISSKKGSNNNLKILSVTRKNDLITLYHWLYDDINFVMKRKHDKFVELLTLFKERGYDIGELRNFD